MSTDTDKPNTADTDAAKPAARSTAKAAAKVAAKPVSKPSATAPAANDEAHPERHHELAQMRHDPEAIRHAFETGEYPYATRMARAAYERKKAKLQAELLKVQLWVQDTGQKFVLLVEGRDAAGKGGTIKRYM